MCGVVVCGRVFLVWVCFVCVCACAHGWGCFFFFFFFLVVLNNKSWIVLDIYV